MDVLVFVLMKEITPDQITKVDFNYFQYFKVIPQMFSEFKSFKHTVIGFSFMITSQVGLVYYALYAVRSFQADGSDIALFTAITGLANIAGSVVFGIMADRFGHRFILILSSLLSGLAGILVIAFPGIWMVYAAFALTNLGLCGYNLSCGIYIIEQIPRERLPMGISINTMITLVVSSIITVGSSFLVDSISFSAVFLIAGLAGLLGGILLFAGGKSVKHTYAEQIQL
jgi:MFS family permease